MTLSFYYVGIFLASLVLSAAATPVAKRLALRLGFVDRPGGRKIHDVVTPYLGGVAIYAGFVFAVCLVVGFDPTLLRQSTSLLGGATLLLAFGLWDDRSGMDPKVKLLGQTAAAALAIGSGIQLRLFGSLPADLVLSLVWFVGLSNALNLLDNMDGLSGGVVAISGTCLFLLAAAGGQFLVASMAAALVGACLGFLRYNFSPATIFMGDAGSLFLGYAIALIAAKLRLPHSEPVNFAILLLVMAIPILDTSLVTLDRLRHGRPVSLGGQDHCSHRLVALGYSRKRAVVILWGIACAEGAAALALYFDPGRAGAVLGTLAGAGTVALLVMLGAVRIHGANPPVPGPTERSPVDV